MPSFFSCFFMFCGFWIFFFDLFHSVLSSMAFSFCHFFFSLLVVVAGFSPLFSLDFPALHLSLKRWRSSKAPTTSSAFCAETLSSPLCLRVAVKEHSSCQDGESGEEGKGRGRGSELERRRGERRRERRGRRKPSTSLSFIGSRKKEK